MKQVLVPIALVRVFQQCSRESVHVPEHPPCEAITNVRFGSNADIGALPHDVRFTPKSRHPNIVAWCPNADIG